MSVVSKKRRKAKRIALSGGDGGCGYTTKDLEEMANSEQNASRPFNNEEVNEEVNEDKDHTG